MSQPNALEQARQLFAGNGLPLPYIPPEMAGDVRQVAEGIYGTRPDQPHLYHLPGFLQEVGAGPVADYLLFGQDGRGLSSYAMHYYLVRGPLALFVQESWGGVYGDQGADNRIVAERFAQAEALVQAVEAAGRRGGFKPGERLVVVASSFTGSRWRWLDGFEPGEFTFIASPAWHEETELFPAVWQALEDRSGG